MTVKLFDPAPDKLTPEQQLAWAADRCRDAASGFDSLLAGTCLRLSAFNFARNFNFLGGADVILASLRGLMARCQGMIDTVEHSKEHA